MRILVVVATMCSLLLWAACGGGGEDAKSFANIRELVAALDKHTLSNEYRPRVKLGTDEQFAGTFDVNMTKSKLFGAKVGTAYNVEPGSYGLEIYVYDNSKTASEYSTDLATTGSHFHVEGNVALLLTTSTTADLTRLVSDIRD